MDLQQAESGCHDALLTLDEAAALLKVSKSWIYERTRKGTIPHVKLGKYLRFPTAALLAWLETHSRSAGEDLHTSRAHARLARDAGVPRLRSLSSRRSV